MLKIAFPNKGRLAEDARDLFEDAGLPIRFGSERALVARLGNQSEAIFVRAQDIPEFVADGAADLGVTGWDLVNESERDLSARIDLGFGRCRLVVAVRDDSDITSVDQIAAGARVATAFPRVARRFFEASGRPVELVPVSGAAEITPHLGIADLVVDLVSTGSTLKVNGLREIATVLESSARLVCRRDDRPEDDPARAGDERAVAIDRLVVRLESVVRARMHRYMMANVPRDALARVKAVLPGLDGPTVVDVLDGGRHVAVHAVVATAEVDRVITDLKALGATGILVTRIERLMP
ncbi:MAG: ATP phosphoribosyltransferase [Gemmatimonadales bacterium]